MESFFDMKMYTSLFINYGIKVLIAVAILLVGFWVSNRIAGAFRKVMMKRDVDVSLTTFLASFLNIILKVLLVILIIGNLGVETFSITAILGAASLAVGMALSGTLQNFAGGIVILFLKPFRVGDFIEAQAFSGTVQEIQIFNTLIKTPDNKTIFIPNGALSNGSLTNYTREGKRRLDVVFSLGYGDDMDHIRKVLMQLISEDSRIYKDPEPVVLLTALGNSTISVTARMWLDSGDYAAVQVDLTEKAYKVFPKENIHFPFPQMDVHIMKNNV